MEEQKLKNYWIVYSKAWQLFKKYHDAKTDAECERCMKQAMEIKKQYPGRFTDQILSCVIAEIDRIR